MNVIGKYHAHLFWRKSRWNSTKVHKKITMSWKLPYTLYWKMVQVFSVRIVRYWSYLWCQNLLNEMTPYKIDRTFIYLWQSIDSILLSLLLYTMWKYTDWKMVNLGLEYTVSEHSYQLPISKRTDPNWAYLLIRNGHRTSVDKIWIFFKVFWLQLVNFWLANHRKLT